MSSISLTFIDTEVGQNFGIPAAHKTKARTSLAGLCGPNGSTPAANSVNLSRLSASRRGYSFEIERYKDLLCVPVFLTRDHDFDFVDDVTIVVPRSFVQGIHEARSAFGLRTAVEDGVQACLFETGFGILRAEIVKHPVDSHHALVNLARTVLFAEEAIVDDSTAAGTQRKGANDADPLGWDLWVIVAANLVRENLPAIWTEVIISLDGAAATFAHI
jgi:hypothetical protein